MTAPDPGLTDLIAAHVLSGPFIEYDSDGHHADDFYRCGENCKWTSNEGTVNRSAFATHAAHVALVVEQHTNGRIAELEAAVAEAERRGDEQFNLLDETLTADRNRIAKRCNIAEAAIARVRGEVSAYSEIIPAVALTDLRAALEGEQQ